MNAIVMDEVETSMLGMAAILGWLAGVLFGTAVLALLALGEFVQSAPGVGAFLLQVIVSLPSVMLIAIIGGVIALPAPFIAFTILWLAERISPRARSLPFWFAVGTSASLPSAWYVWSAPTLLFFDEEGPSLTWDSLLLPALVLACGVVGTFWAWRWRQRESAE